MTNSDEAEMRDAISIEETGPPRRDVVEEGDVMIIIFCITFFPDKTEV